MPPESSVMDAPPAAPASSPPPVAPSSSPPINVTPAAIDKGPTAPPPKPGSAKDRMFGDLRKKAGMEEETPPVTSPSSETTTETPEATATETPETTTTTPAVDPKKGKVSPWKLVDEHKAARLKAETELAELRKSVVAPEKLKELETKAETAERRAKELDEEIKFHDYRKSSEFAEKYQKPYEEAWKKHMADLGELTVSDPATGNERPLAPQDLLELVNMPLKEAKARAMENFGDFADEVMGARKEIRGLFEAQTKALEEARKGGAERESQRAQQFRQQQESLAKEIGETWKASNELAAADEKVGKFFKPIEGDEDGNTRLKKGYDLADKAFTVSPLDPRLTPEQRKEVVQLHAAIRNRAAAFGRLSAQNEKFSSKIAELEAELGKFKNAQPGAGEGNRDAQPGHHTAKDDVMGALRKLAH